MKVLACSAVLLLSLSAMSLIAFCQSNRCSEDKAAPSRAVTLQHGLSLHGGYTYDTVPGGRFAGLGGNFGVGTNAADSANSFFVPNYALLNVGLRFGDRNMLFSVNATNLTDKRYVATCSGLSYCYYGYVRNVIGQVKYHFE